MNVEGTRLHQQGNYQGALKRFHGAIASDPANADGYYNVAATYHKMGKLNGSQTDLEQAEIFYNQCLDRDGNHIDCHRGLAVLLAETGRSDAAARLLEGWVMRAPGSAEPKIELARLMEEYGNKEQAKQRLLEAISIDPKNDRALTALGRLREESGDYVQAYHDYQRSLALNRFQPQVASRMAALQNAMGTHAIQPRLGADTRLVAEPVNWNRY